MKGAWEKMALSCAFTGHRPYRLPFHCEEDPGCILLKASLTEQIKGLIQGGVESFLSGMAMGIDLWAAEIVLCLRRENPNLKLICVLPCPSQADFWNLPMKKRYFTVLSQSDKQIMVSSVYGPECMRQRNRWMVEHADLLLAVYNGISQGGTAYTLQYAISKKKPVVLLDPETLKITAM